MAENIQTEKRKDYISWDFYFMGVAFMSALRSKDPSTRNGAVIVDPKTNHIISSGYNGMPNGKDDSYTWNREGTPNKYDFVLHAEENAILNATQPIKDCMMYIYSEKLYMPCKGCMRLIAQAGIREIIVTGIIKENTDVYNWEPTKYIISTEGIEVGILNDPLGMFNKFKEEADKAIIMFEKNVYKGELPEKSYLSKKSEEEIKEDINDLRCYGFDIDKNLKNEGLEFESDISKKAEAGMAEMGFEKQK
jgi:dCMP deaminase